MISGKAYADGLPTFESLEAAREGLRAAREATLSALLREHGTALNLDFEGESLKRLEKWFFESGSPEAGEGGYSVPQAIGFYLGEILCRSSGFVWVVEESPVRSGSYDVGIRRPLLTLMLTQGRRPVREGNEGMDSLWRELGVFAR